ARTFAMRIWLDPMRLAQFGLNTDQVVAALQANNFTAAAGATRGYFDIITNRAMTDATSAEEFRRLVLRSTDGEVVRLGDVATVELGSQTRDSSVLVNGEEAVFIGIQVAPEAN